jgi:hypothetical protein
MIFRKALKRAVRQKLICVIFIFAVIIRCDILNPRQAANLTNSW